MSLQGVADGVADGVLDHAGLCAELAQASGPELAREIGVDSALTQDLAVYQPVQYNYLWHTSLLFLFSACYTVYQQKYDLVVYPATIFVTSLNYWRNPKFNSWQRTLDVGCVQSSVVYHIFRSSGAENAYPFYTYMLIGFLCYLISNYNHRLKRLYMSSVFHSLVHVFGNIAIVYLYSGEIMDSWDNPVMRGVRIVLENLVD